MCLHSRVCSRSPASRKKYWSGQSLRTDCLKRNFKAQILFERKGEKLISYWYITQCYLYNSSYSKSWKCFRIWIFSFKKIIWSSMSTFSSCSSSLNANWGFFAATWSITQSFCSEVPFFLFFLFLRLMSKHTERSHRGRSGTVVFCSAK